MAIKKDVSLPSGIVVPNAYIRVESVLVMKGSMQIKLAYRVDADKPAFLLDDRVADYDLNGANPATQAYIAIKASADFSDAIDC